MTLPPRGNPFGLKRLGKQLGFGAGIHVCIGAALTRLETRIAVEQLARQASAIEVTGPLDYRPSTTHRGVVALPVMLEPPASP